MESLINHAAAALNTILGRWGKKASPEWNISGELCSGFATDKTDWDYYPNINPFIKCDCTDSNNTLCHITRLNFRNNYLTGPIPPFIGKFTSMQYLSLSLNPLSGLLPKELGNLTNLVSLGIGSNNFTGGLPEELGNLTKLQRLKASDNGFNGKIPEYLGTITNLVEIRIGDIVNGISPLAFISNMTSLSTIILRNCKISSDLGAIDFSKFEHLELLFLGNNSLTGRLPDGISSSLKAIDFSYNQLTGSFPSWASQNNLQLNLVANNFLLESTSDSTLPWGLNCLQQDTPCFRGSPKYYSFAVDCGSNGSTRGSDDTIYEADPTNLGAATYYVTGQTRWGVSSVGNYFQREDAKNIIYSSQNFQNVVHSELFQTARMSPSSLRYYGLGLENGNYTVLLQFAEFAFPDSQTWLSLGRRVFDIYIQGALKEKDFDIRKTAGGKSFRVVNRSFMVTVSKNFLEIHLFWAGKGTDAIPIKGYYGPMISALRVTPNFTPTVRNGIPKRESKAGAISGILIGAIVLVLAALFGVFTLIKKRRALAQQKEGDSNLNLDWVMRFEIILGIARGLIYLQEESSIRIVHRDIKASNVLLDTNLVPKISDFGLAKLYDENQTHVSTRIAGTLGYLAPEYAMRGHLSEKADIFAFGVVMLETVAGRPNTDNSLEESKICLLEWAWGLYEMDQALGIVDPSLKEFDKDEAFRVIYVALVCTQGSPHQRPPMSKVVTMLTGDVDVAKVVTKPSYITEWQLRGGGNSSNTTSS
uniref:non-specific serine/threonine protein kinase n=1 Tax=Oryza nivara TaxID=4536 RepID=A0A0E0HBN2_ORYNI